MSKKHTIVFVCGGTGGHIYPAIALANAARNTRSIFIGEENREGPIIVPKYGFEFIGLESVGKNIIRLIRAVVKATRVLKQLNPTCVMSMGGAISMPVIISAKRLGIPVYIHEQNTIPGRANRMLSRFAKKVFVSFDITAPYFNHQHVIVSGNPVRDHFLESSNASWIKENLHPGQKTVLIFGGSQGADKLNQWVIKQYPILLENMIQIIHISGRKHFKSMENLLKKMGIQHISNPLPRLIHAKHDKASAVILSDEDQMNVLYEMADWVICRSGATTIAELIHFQKPALLIPFPFSKDDHQTVNAEVFTRHHEGKLLFEKDLDHIHLLNQLNTLGESNRNDENERPHDIILTEVLS